MRTSRCNLLIQSPTGSGKTFAICEAARLVLDSSAGEILYVAEPLIALAEQVYNRLGGEREARCALRTGPSRRGDDDESRVVVCTYEVLARICLSSPQRLDCCSTIVIDEIHYIASDRGPVIQEILQATQTKNIVALSGTLPNKAQFARFLSSLNGLPTYIAGADTRPVPLSFSVYDVGSSRCMALRAQSPAPRIDEADIGGLKGKQDLLSLLAVLASHDSMPLLVVLFSCRKLDQMADWAASKDYLTASERSKVVVAFATMLRGIPPDEHSLFAPLREQALRGIGRHHSHLPVPYLELLCRLAELRLTKVIFSSSTLSAGINLPVRTVALCGARVPQKLSDGEMSYDLISPMLFQQLAGRAGRPGLEPQGYCIIVGRGAAGYRSAQGLVMRQQPAVVPHDDMSVGDVLRARANGRTLGFDKALFADPSLRPLVHLTVRLRGEAEAAMAACYEPSVIQAGKLLGEAIETVLNNKSLLPLARDGTAPARFLWFARNGLATVSPSDGCQLPPEAIALFSAAGSRIPAIPLQILAETLKVRQALRVVAAATRETLVVASIERALMRRESVLGQHAMIAEEDRIARLIPSKYLSATGAATDLGRAACAIRSLPDPCLVLDLILEAGVVEPLRLAALLSSALGDGKAAPPTLDDDPSLLQLPCLTERRLVEGVERWMRGDSVTSIVDATEVPVGVFCRHVLRLHDLVEEVRQAVSAIGVLEAAQVCERASEALARGLPFLKRGVGRVQCPE